MIVSIIPRVGGTPITLDASQVVVYQDNGTPIAVAAEYGPERSQAVSMAGQADFQRFLRLLGVNTTVVVDRLPVTKPHPGAVLVAGPR